MKALDLRDFLFFNPHLINHANLEARENHEDFSL